MKIAAVFSVWDDFDMLEHSVRHIEPLVDVIIIIASNHSNYNEYSPIPDEWVDRVILLDPIPGHPASVNETRKRNYGLDIARQQGYTHYICMDADEFYLPEEFNKAKESIGDLNGLVCRSQVYFGSPELTIGLDKTLVPFIHKITPTLKHQYNASYPYAWIGRDILIDPTRQLNINSGVELCDVTMLHMSWVRKDYTKKIRNSTARNNIEKSTIIHDLMNAKEGYYCEFYGKTLVRAQVDFGIKL